MLSSALGLVQGRKELAVKSFNLLTVSPQHVARDEEKEIVTGGKGIYELITSRLLPNTLSLCG